MVEYVHRRLIRVTGRARERERERERGRERERERESERETERERESERESLIQTNTVKSKRRTVTTFMTKVIQFQQSLFCLERCVL